MMRASQLLPSSRALCVDIAYRSHLGYSVGMKTWLFGMGNPTCLNWKHAMCLCLTSSKKKTGTETIANNDAMPNDDFTVSSFLLMSA